MIDRTKEKAIRLYTVLPCYNEEEILRSSAEKMMNLYKRLINAETDVRLSDRSRIMFINDGSSDSTWSIIQELCNQDDLFCGISLSKNCGHQIAIFAGMQYAVEYNAECVITIDADLQQDAEAIPKFLKMYLDGCDIVYGVRKSRNTDGLFKKSSANLYYRFMNLLGCNIVPQSADYRLMSARAVRSLAEYRESNLFIRGLVTELGYKTDVVHFDVSRREAGKSKYNLKKMIALALDGITSFSTKPLRWTLFFGLVASAISVVMMITTIVDYIRGVTVPGWSTLTISIWFIGGVQLLSMGIMGEYVGRTYIESKHRPRYFIGDTVGIDHDRDTRG